MGSFYSLSLEREQIFAAGQRGFNIDQSSLFLRKPLLFLRASDLAYLKFRSPKSHVLVQYHNAI
jgi:hypothetical protein